MNQHTRIDHPTDLGDLIRFARRRRRISRRQLARSASCTERQLTELEIGLFTAFPVVTLELLRRQLELDHLEVDAYTGSLWRDPPRNGFAERPCCGLRCTPGCG